MNTIGHNNPPEPTAAEITKEVMKRHENIIDLTRQGVTKAQPMVDGPLMDDDEARDTLRLARSLAARLKTLKAAKAEERKDTLERDKAISAAFTVIEAAGEEVDDLKQALSDYMEEHGITAIEDPDIGGGVSRTATLSIEVVNRDRVPDEWLVVDLVAVRKFVQDMRKSKRIPEIPGIKIEDKPGVVLR